MTYVVSLEDFVPGQRYDGLAWTQARIEESADSDGPWVAIETITFDDPDTDPENPATRNFTSDLAALPAGWYRVVFVDALAVEQQSAPVYFPATAQVLYKPTLAYVGGLNRARTKDVNGAELGTFNEDTRPTGEQVEGLIDHVGWGVAMRVGIEIPLELHYSAKHVVALGTSAEIERSYQPEQSVDVFSTYQSMRLSFEESLAKLVTAVQLRDLFAETVEA